jgi:hypothetical protein
VSSIRWRSCLVAAAAYAAGFVILIYVLVTVGIPMILLLVLGLSGYPLAMAYLMRSIWKLTLTEILLSYLLVSVPVILFGLLKNPIPLRLLMDLGTLAIGALFNLAGCKIATMREITPD